MQGGGREVCRGLGMVCLRRNKWCWDVAGFGMMKVFIVG
jgi:hypothetical protein